MSLLCTAATKRRQMLRTHDRSAIAQLLGEVPEWSIGAVSKTVERASVPRVRIPLSPPLLSRGAAPPSGRADCRCAVALLKAIVRNGPPILCQLFLTLVFAKTQTVYGPVLICAQFSDQCRCCNAFTPSRSGCPWAKHPFLGACAATKPALRQNCIGGARLI